MTQETDFPRISPMLIYRDASAAIDFLCEAFGFKEEFRMPMPDGRVGHAELSYGASRVMLASEYPEFGLVGPATFTETDSQLYCRVDDVEAHFDVARDRGATIVSEPRFESHGATSYRAIDPEGRRWIFSQPTEADADTNSGTMDA